MKLNEASKWFLIRGPRQGPANMTILIETADYYTNFDNEVYFGF